MTEEVIDSVLLNCTALLAETDGLIQNRTQLLDLLNTVLTEIDPARRDVLSDCLYPPTQRPFNLAWWQKLAWTIVFGAMLVVAIGGNVIVMWIVLAHRRMRTVTNYFLVNLSVSDILMSLLNCMFNFIFMVNSDWPFGAIYCTINNFVANVTVAASVFTLVAISVDRYMAIVRPLQHRTSRRRAGVVLVVIWVCSGLLAVPCILYSTTMTRRYTSGQTRKVCYMLWPDGRYPTSMTEYVYNLIFLGVTYLLPVTAMAVCYTIMGKELWGSRSIGELTHRQSEAIKCKKKVVRMFIFVVTIFAFCWLPYHGYFIYAYHDNSIASYKYVQHVYLAFYWLAMANAMVNPVIYYWMNNRFRLYFQQIICQCCCFRKKAKDALELPSIKNTNSHWDLQRYKSGRCEIDRNHEPQVLWRQRTKDAEVLSRPHPAVPAHPNLIHASTAIIIGPIVNRTHVF